MAWFLQFYNRGENLDRRLAVRVEWNGPVKYRLMQTDHYQTGLLVNISDRGAMLWLKEDIPLGSELEVLIQTRLDAEQVHFVMKIVRTEETREKYIGYGCRLQMTVNEVG